METMLRDAGSGLVASGQALANSALASGTSGLEAGHGLAVNARSAFASGNSALEAGQGLAVNASGALASSRSVLEAGQGLAVNASSALAVVASKTGKASANSAQEFLSGFVDSGQALVSGSDAGQAAKGQPLHIRKIPSNDAEDEEDFQSLKATTMYRMVEDLDLPGGTTKCLFLTNSQANLICKSSDRIQRLLDAFGIPQPKLLIEFLPSWGGIDNLATFVEPPGKRRAGVVQGELPWDSFEQADKAETRLSRFMVDVLLPLAVETNALILCDSRQNICLLSTLLNRVMALQKSKWGESPPFSILTYTSSMQWLYNNKDPNAQWRLLRDASRAWRARDAKIQQLFDASPVMSYSCDLDPTLKYTIVVDSIGDGGLNDNSGCVNLITELGKHLHASIPRIAFKTGMSLKETLKKDELGGLSAAVDIVNGGSPMLFIDMRERPMVTGKDRKDIIEAACQQFETTCDDFLSLPTPCANVFDVMALSYFRDVLRGDGNSTARIIGEEQTEVLPLCEAIKLRVSGDRKNDEAEVDQASNKKATAEQVDDVVRILARRFFSDAFKVAADRETLESQNINYETYFQAQILAWSTYANSLLNSDNFHSANVVELDDAKHLVRALVKLDRLPSENSLEGLLLIRDAWDEFDVCMFTASRYKLLSKTMFCMLLLLQIGMIVFTVLQSLQEGSSSRRLEQAALHLLTEVPTERLRLALHEALPDLMHAEAAFGAGEGRLLTSSSDLTVSADVAKAFTQVVFALSLIVSGVVSISAFVNPTKRWRHLRRCACSLESVLWQYRTRVGDFAVSATNPKGPEDALVRALNTWRDDLYSGTDLQSTSLTKMYPKSVYKHNQRAENVNALVAPMSLDAPVGPDDYYSPAKPGPYIAWRLLPAMRFHQQRMPRYERSRTFWVCLSLLCTATSTALAYLEFPAWVAIVSAIASATTSWQEYSGLTRKLERCNSSIQGIKKLHAWWKSLGEVEQSATINITKLVISGEGIITHDLLIPRGDQDDNVGSSDKTSDGDRQLQT
eukprot:TRINITY_DN77917_c0_g1_i1.p1 TRINITY_DN77917_c0_g1~~TRINITY_DN77917_c0_g1_i1.p1  ORF type:complete len:1060 (+),score=124.93 TRINITY_DN77917_c0_g1_i1:117-3182(+)